MKYRFFILFSITILAVLSCGRASEKASASQVTDYVATEAAGDDEALPPPPPPGGDEYRKGVTAADTAGSPGTNTPGDDGVAVERKLIKEGSLEFEVDNLLLARKLLLQAAARLKGYAGSENEYNADGRNSTTIIIRVPAANFDSLLIAATNGITRFDRKDIQVKDVTAEFVDIQARLKTKKDLENRYLELLKKANTVAEMLEIEREMGSLRADIESIEGQLNVMKNQVALSTLTVTLYETVSVPGFFGERLGSGFVNGWNSLLDFFVILVSLWPFILLGAAGYFGIRRWRLRKRVK